MLPSIPSEAGMGPVKRAASMKMMKQNAVRDDSDWMDPLLAHAGHGDNRPSSGGKMTVVVSREEKEKREKEKRRKTVHGKLDALGSNLDRIRSDLEGARKKTRYIRVKVLKAKNLPRSDEKKIDAFVKLTLDGNSASTQIKQGDLNPSWNEVLILAAKIPMIPPTMLVEVFDHDIMGVQQHDKDVLIASCEVRLESMMEEEKTTINKSFSLHNIPRRGRIREAAEMEQATVAMDLSLVSASEAKKHLQSSSRMRRGTLVHQQHIPAGLQKDLSEQSMRQGRESHLKEDSVRMVLVGHMGRLRHGSSEVRRLAIQSISKIAGERGKGLPKSHTGYWDTQVIKCLTERMEKDGVLEVRLEAIDALGFVAKQGNSDAIRVLCKGLKDPSRDVRLAAVNTLLRVVNSGNEVAISSMGECLEDSDHRVRAAACEALPHLSSVFDNRLIAEAKNRMSSIHAVVRQVAVKALASVTTRGSPVVIDGLSKAVGDVDAQVKMTAMMELTKQVNTGTADVVQLIVEQLRDTRSDVRRTAASCLESLVMKGDKVALLSILGLMDDPGKDQYGHFTVQISALKALQTIAAQETRDQFTPRSESKMFSSIVDKITSPDWCVRREVAVTLRTCALGNEDLVLQQLLTLLEDPVQEVRNEAARTIKQLAPGRLDWLVCSLACLLASPSPSVRGVASTMLSSLLPGAEDNEIVPLLSSTKQGVIPSHAEVISFLDAISVQPGDEEALKGFVYCLDHHSSEVRELAMDSLKSFTQVGQDNVIRDLISRLENRGPDQIMATALALSRIVELNDERAVKAIMDLLESDHREVRGVVHRALQNILPEGDTRITIAWACMRLEPDFHSESERKEALRQLAQLAYASHHSRVHGWSVEDADLAAFWQLIRQPRMAVDEAAKLLPRILARLSDENVWVRTAAVKAACECGDRGDQAVVTALMDLLPDESFAVRTAVVEALSAIATIGDSAVIFALCKTLNDVSHLVRMASVKALRVLVKVGDREAARALMSWFRRAWEYLAIRGNDIDIKLEVAHLLIDVLSIQEMQKCKTFIASLSSPNLHRQRNELASFDDTLSYQNLIESYMQYEHRVSSRSAANFEDPSGRYQGHQVKAIVMIQKWVAKKMEDGLNGTRRPTWDSHARKAIKSIITVEEKEGGASLGSKRLGFNGPTHMEKEDQVAEKILRRIVPLDVRSSAIAAAHERSQDPTEDIQLWDKMRWTERLRLCEEVANKAWPL